MPLDKTLSHIAKKAGIRITETSDKLTIKPYFGLRHNMNISATVLMVMGLVCLIGINVKPHTGLGTKIGVSCLALLFTGIGAALWAMHSTSFVTAVPGSLAYRHKFKLATLVIDHSTAFKIRQETKVSSGSVNLQSHHYIITQIFIRQADKEYCITEYWLTKNAETEKGSIQLANNLVALLKSKTSSF